MSDYSPAPDTEAPYPEGNGEPFPPQNGDDYHDGTADDVLRYLLFVFICIHFASLLDSYVKFFLQPTRK